MSLGEEITVAVVSGSLGAAGADLLACTPGDGSSDAVNVRALVPVALSETCVGAIQGALLAILVALVVSGGVVAVVKQVKRLSWTGAAALTQFPSITLIVCAQLQMGLVVCGGKVMLAGQDDVGLGAFGLVLGVGMFPAYPLLARLLVSRRCYRLALTEAAPGTHHTLARRVLTWTLPQYSLDSTITISRSFAHVVGRCRRPSPLWAGIATFQPIAMMFCVFAQSGYCAWMFSLTGLVFIAAGMGTIAFRPHRIPLVNVISCVSLCLTGVVVGLSARLATTPLDANASSAVGALSMVQTAVTCVRVGHLLYAFTTVRLRGSKWLKRVSPDGESNTNPKPVFDITCCASRRSTKIQEDDSDTVPMLHVPRATQPAPLAAPPVAPNPVSYTHLTLPTKRIV
eukprot:TRINITY_DN19712_c0_g1_i5.p1 TRINITY_DN19712_c0_g1~~TRINITY_DN19712_c0_g1_i5.p1  ORF type:complete len:399 (+),score=74.00 TRINITY_DN19712_c0_g1_i5:300-1496(+)